MILNLCHRPIPGRMMEMFRLQQDIAHELHLKVTILMQYENMFDEEAVRQVKQDAQTYGDEIGLWFGDIPGPELNKVFGGKELFLWLYSTEEKEQLITLIIGKFREVFGQDPVSVGAYHMDAVSMKILKKVCPKVKITVAGCFEEGVKVFHGCNNSWYLFNEGMPWGPWYPSRYNSLCPAASEEDAIDLVAVPHLCRDLALSYEGRNDYFATHPHNVQRGMANVGEIAPYTLNLTDMYRMQEEYNDGFSYCHVFVGPNWLTGNPNIQDSDEITQGLYREYLAYFVELRNQGKLIDMHMSEFADWFKENVPYGKPQVYLAKEMLYGSGKHYFWYIDADMRVLIDTTQGGSIGDFRPFAGRQERYTGTDSPYLAIGSNPYIIQSQYRSGFSHHYADGARTTLLVKHQEETIDLCACPTRVAGIDKNDERTEVSLTPSRLKFKDGLEVTVQTSYTFRRNGEIEMKRNITDISHPAVKLEVTEYLKGCYGVIEYPENLRGIRLGVVAGEERTIDYDYKSRTLELDHVKCVYASIPQINAEIRMEPKDGSSVRGQVVEGYLFNPYYTLTLTYEVNTGKELKTCLKTRRIQ